MSYAELSDEEICKPKYSAPYSEKDDMTSGIVIVEGQRFYISKELVSMYSADLKERFANADKGVIEELPVVKLEDESATDVITMLNHIYPDTNQVLNDGNIYTVGRLSNKFNIKRLRHDIIQYIKAQAIPKFIYRQLADNFGLHELADMLTDEKLATQVPTAAIEREVAECAQLDPSIPLRIGLIKLKATRSSAASLCNDMEQDWYYKNQFGSHKVNCKDDNTAIYLAKNRLKYGDRERYGITSEASFNQLESSIRKYP